MTHEHAGLALERAHARLDAWEAQKAHQRKFLADAKESGLADDLIEKARADMDMDNPAHTDDLEAQLNHVADLTRRANAGGDDMAVIELEAVDANAYAAMVREMRMHAVAITLLQSMPELDILMRPQVGDLYRVQQPGDPPLNDDVAED